MARFPLLQSVNKPGALWRMSFGLLLWCGFMTSAGATTLQGGDGHEIPLLADQAEQLALAGSGEYLRVRSTLRKDGSAAGNSGYEGSRKFGQAVVANLLLADLRSSAPGFFVTLSVNLPAQERHTLPAPRDPPNA